VTNGLAEAVIQLIAVYDDLLRMDGLDGAERNGEVTGVLDVDDQLGPAVRRDPTHSTEGLETKTSKPS
jgi:hypothetical protein